MKNDKKKNELHATATLFYIVAAIDYLAALSYFIGGGDTSLGVVWMCIGSPFLCLGAANTKRAKEEQNNPDEEEKPDDKTEE